MNKSYFIVGLFLATTAASAAKAEGIDCPQSETPYFDVAQCGDVIIGGQNCRIAGYECIAAPSGFDGVCGDAGETELCTANCGLAQALCGVNGENPGNCGDVSPINPCGSAACPAAADSFYGSCSDEVPGNGVDDDGDGETDEENGTQDSSSCRMAGLPVDLFTREMYVGPIELAHIASGVSDAHDLVFRAVYDSKFAKRDLVDDNRVTGEARQRPYRRILGVGWRHNFESRLILDKGSPLTGNPARVIWEHEGATTRFYRDFGPNSTGLPKGGGHYRAEPGTSAKLYRDGSASPPKWKLLTQEGDLLEFEEGPTSTEQHPWNIADPNHPSGPNLFHAKLRRIYPNALKSYRILLNYEGDTIGTGLEQAPSGTCTDIIIGSSSTGSTCGIASRGLLARVGVQWLTNGGAPASPGPSIELKYDLVGDAHQEAVLRELAAGADRSDGQTPSALAWMHYSTTTNPRQLFDVTDGLRCIDSPSSPAACKKAAFSYAATTGNSRFALASVSSSVQGSGIAGGLQQSESFGWSAGATIDQIVVADHKSPGLELIASSPRFSRAMTWTRNNIAETDEFDAGSGSRLTGALVSCGSGTCGDPSSARSAGLALPPTFARFDTGTTHWRTLEGVDVFVERDDDGNELFRCEVIADQMATPTCVLERSRLAFAGDIVSIHGGVLRKATRSYYQGDEPKQLRATAEYLETTNGTEIAFPKFDSEQTCTTDDDCGFNANRGEHCNTATHTCASNTGWFSGAEDLTVACPNRSAALDFLTFNSPSGPEHARYDVVIYDRDSDGDMIANEQPAIDLSTTGDWQVARTTRVVEHPDGATDRSCSTTPLDDYGRSRTDYPNEARRSYNNSTRARVDRTYVAIPGPSARTTGRLFRQRRWTFGSPSTQIVEMQLCQAQDRGTVDAEGRVTCAEVPLDVNTTPSGAQLLRVRETSAVDSTIAGATKRTLSFNDETDTALLQTFEVRTASGFLVETGTIGGNSSRYISSVANNAAVGPRVVEVRNFDSVGNLLGKRTLAFDQYGRFTDARSFDASNQEAWHHEEAFNADDQPQTIKDYYDATHFYTTTRTYNTFDAPDTEVEGDGGKTTWSYGTAGDAVARLKTVQRGTASIVDVRELGYGRRGDITSLGDDTQMAYVYDGFHRVKSELPAGGSPYSIDYVYDDFARLRSTTWHATPTSTERTVRYVYDGLDRILQECPNDGCGTFSLFYRYDDKGAVVGQAGLTNNYQRGRLASVEDPYGITYFEYDALGRVIAEKRHEGPLPFSASNVVTTTYTYGAAGELLFLSYPSSRSVRYIYGNDKVTPTRVDVASTSGNTYATVAANIAVDGHGRVKSWEWTAAGLNNSRTITRDWLGRTLRITDKYANATKSDIFYSDSATGAPWYDGDGDLTNEMDAVAPTMLSTSSTAANVQRAYTYYSTRDQLQTWDDQGTVHFAKLGSRGQRSEEDIAGVTYTYNYLNSSSEAITSRLTSAQNDNNELQLSYDSLGQVTSIDTNPQNGTGFVELSNMTYGELGNLRSWTVNGLGFYAQEQDFQMRRVRKNTPITTTFTKWRYGVGAQPLEETRFVNGMVQNRTEWVYLAGQPIAAVVTGVFGPFNSPSIVDVHTDRTGVPRKVTTTTGTSLERLIMDAWGHGSVVVDNSSQGLPPLGARYPGQYEDSETGLLSNQWRTLIPQSGTYASRDPQHYQTAQGAYGPQAYAYVSAAPLRMIDPAGLYQVDPAAWGNDEVRIAALYEALGLVRNSPELACYFARTFGRTPFDDDGLIRPNDFGIPTP